jgi:hypothetical protein
MQLLYIIKMFFLFNYMIWKDIKQKDIEWHFSCDILNLSLSQKSFSKVIEEWIMIRRERMKDKFIYGCFDFMLLGVSNKLYACSTILQGETLKYFF